MVYRFYLKNELNSLATIYSFSSENKNPFNPFFICANHNVRTCLGNFAKIQVLKSGFFTVTETHKFLTVTSCLNAGSCLFNEDRETAQVNWLPWMEWRRNVILFRFSSVLENIQKYQRYSEISRLSTFAIYNLHAVLLHRLFYKYCMLVEFHLNMLGNLTCL